MSVRFPTALLLLYLTTAVVAAEPSRLHLYVFQEGLPLPEVRLKRRQRVLAVTDRNGAAHLQLPAGEYAFDLVYQGRSLKQLPLKLGSGGSTQLILSIPSRGAEGDVDIESSSGEFHLAGEAGSAAGEATAIISGRLYSLEGGKPISGARIFVSGVRQMIRSDEEGRFTVPVPPGEYSLSVIHPEYSTQTRTGLKVTGGGKVEVELELTPSGLQLEEYTVTAPYLEGGTLAMLDEQRNSANVVDVISSDQISNAGASNAAGALKRVTGLTLIDGKFVYVRGLGERYSSTMLNGAMLPSPDPTGRVVPLDLFAASVLGGIVVQKTYSPDMPGEFGGGTILLRTRGIPEEKVRRFALYSGGNSRSTFQEGLTYRGGDTDFLGIDDGTRALPARLDRISDGGRRLDVFWSEAETEQAGESLPDIYDLEGKTLPPDAGLKINLGDRFESYDSNWGWGYNFSLNYKNKWRDREEKRVDYILDGRGGLVADDTINRKKTENDIDLSSMLNLALELGEQHNLQSTTLLSRKTTGNAILDEGYRSENDLFVKESHLEWVERQLLAQQFSGEHHIDSLNDLKVDWQFSYALADRYEPDSRFYRYQKDESGRYYFDYRLGESNERVFERLDDTNTNFGVNLALPLYDFLSGQARFKAGASVNTKERDSKIVRFRFETRSDNNLDPAVMYNDSLERILTPDNIGVDGFRLKNTTLPTDNYTASQTISAAYLMGEYDLASKYKLMTGVRFENSEQRVTTFELANPDQASTEELVSKNVLPAFTASWQFRPDQQLKFAASRTVNRPDFKELSKAPYIDPETRDVVIGNPLLDVASISHLDLRWDWYLTKFEGMSAALFYKQFDKPIERVIRLGAGGIHTFKNAEMAENYGVELNSRFWLSRLFGRAASRFYLESNLSLIDSKVKLGEAGAQQTTDNRPLQGQSPWVVNLTLGYENLLKRSKASLLFHMAGERITTVGTKNRPDLYEQPVPLLDFVYRRSFLFEEKHSKLRLSVKLKNILDPVFEVRQGSDVQKSYNKGRTLSIGMEYSWK